MNRVERRAGAVPLAAIVLVGLLPWTFLRWDGGVGLVFAFGLVGLDPPNLVLLPDYLRLSGGPSGLPRRLLAWPASVLLWGLAAGSALGGLTLGREDRRVTGWLLVLAGVGSLSFAVGQTHPGLLAIPLGTVGCWAVAWWGYGPAIRRVVGR